MTIDKKQDGNKLTVSVGGRLDAMNARKLEAELRTSMEGIKNLVFDFGDLEYIASGGIRVLVAAQKAVGKDGSMILRNLQPAIMEILEMTGLVDVFQIE